MEKPTGEMSGSVALYLALGLGQPGEQGEKSGGTVGHWHLLARLTTQSAERERVAASFCLPDLAQGSPPANSSQEPLKDGVLGSIPTA